MAKNNKASNEVARFKGRVLQVHEGSRPLTRVEIGRLLTRLTMDHVELLSKNMELAELRKEGVTGQCPVYDGMFVGQGVCIAKKYLKYGICNGCSTCKAQEVVNQLNYIFNHAFGGKYQAEWREKRPYKKRTKK